MMISKKPWMGIAGYLLISAMALAQAPGDAQVPGDALAANTLTPQEKQDGWQLLFDGQDLKGWHSYLEKEPGSDWLRLLDNGVRKALDINLSLRSYIKTHSPR